MPEGRETHILPLHDTGPSVLSEVRGLRRNTPGYFLSLIENGVIENISSIQDIPSRSIVAMGGLASACYFYENNSNPEVVKFGSLATTAEVEALKAWKEHGASVTEVKAAGIVPMTIDEERPTKYVILEGVTHPDGMPAPTGNTFIESKPGH